MSLKAVESGGLIIMVSSFLYVREFQGVSLEGFKAFRKTSVARRVG